MKLTLRHFLGAIIAVIGLTFIFSVPITNYMITSFHPTAEHLKSKPSNIPYDWDSVRLINLFNVAQARIKKFFPWYSFEGDYHLVKKSKWLRNLQHRLSLHKNTI